MVNIKINNNFIYYNGTTEKQNINLNFEKLDEKTLKCNEENLSLTFNDNNSLTIKKDDTLSYTKTFSLKNTTISNLKLNETIIHTKIHTTQFIKDNNKINIKAKEYSMNDELLSDIDVNLYIKEANNG